MTLQRLVVNGDSSRVAEIYGQIQGLGIADSDSTFNDFYGRLSDPDCLFILPSRLFQPRMKMVSTCSISSWTANSLLRRSDDDPQRNTQGYPALAMLFVFGVSWFGLYKPELEKIAEYKQKPAANQRQIEELGRQLQEYNPPTEEERQEWARLEQEIDRRLPDGKQMRSSMRCSPGWPLTTIAVNFRRQECRIQTRLMPPRISRAVALTFSSSLSAAIRR